jgi:hypothetical protein
MELRLPRRALGLGLLALCSGCAVQAAPRYHWVADENAPHCTAVVWKRVAVERIPGLCYGHGHAATPDTTCAMGCVVVSPYTEKEAKRLDVDGESLYRHEARHVLGRMKHNLI